MNIFNKTFDDVIKSEVAAGYSTYDYALKNFYPLIDRFDAQRKFLDNKIYKRLESDIINKCVMPPITIAFVKESPSFENLEAMAAYITENIQFGYILDGIQRLRTLNRAKQNAPLLFPSEQPIYFNVIIAANEDMLLYRMITLNNGQKPMTAKHQIEILTEELFDFAHLKINIQTEKEKSEKPIKDAFSFADIVKGYIAFLTNNVHNENNKIIDEKMDEILVGRILATKIEANDVRFKQILSLVDKFSDDSYIKVWFQLSNNFIGFSCGIKTSYDLINSESNDSFKAALATFELAFKAIKPSQVNIGKYRRELTFYFIKNYKDTKDYSESDLIEKFLELTAF